MAIKTLLSLKSGIMNASILIYNLSQNGFLYAYSEKFKNNRQSLKDTTLPSDKNMFHDIQQN